MSGTNNFLKEPAMSEEQLIQAIYAGITQVKECKEQRYNILATGEMGIGNTTTSSAVASVLLDQPVEEKYLEVLKTSDVFNKAICIPDEGLLTWENLYEYPPFVAFFTQFVAAYQEIEDDFK